MLSPTTADQQQCSGVEGLGFNARSKMESAKDTFVQQLEVLSHTAFKLLTYILKLLRTECLKLYAACQRL